MFANSFMRSHVPSSIFRAHAQEGASVTAVYAVRSAPAPLQKAPLPKRVQPRASGTTKNQRLVALLRERARSTRRVARRWLVCAFASTLAALLSCLFASVGPWDLSLLTRVSPDPATTVAARALGALCLLFIAASAQKQRATLRAAAVYDARARALSVPPGS